MVFSKRTWMTGLAAAGVLGVAGLTQAGHHEKKAPEADIVETAVAAGTFKTLAAALGAADLVEALQGDGPFTVLAPTDEAFAALPEGTVETLLKPENKAMLADILTFHVVAADVSAVDAVKAGTAEALNGGDLTFTIKQGRLQVNGVDVINTDIGASNGTIHVIDQVLLPPSGDKQGRMEGDAADDAHAMQLIDTAISRGSRLFNHGQASACASVYEVTLTALANDARLSPQQRQMASGTLAAAERSHSAHDLAWAYRHGLDAMRDSMSSQRDAMMALRSE